MNSPATTPQPDSQPPFLQPGDRVLLFDGVCKLCNASVQFVIRHDRQRRIKLASMQSPQGQALLKWFGQPTERFDTVLLIEDQGLSQRSEAFIRLMAQLPAPWRWLRLLRWIPRPLRDWAYDRIAGNRYRWFGRHEVCLLPSPEHRGRFLDDPS
ncbi:thiol-disulfide oxidoreductase DCC family protein [Pseudomonas sp. Au-Pse12]|uniref:thiol-disulfide oxidoreductase DCC family protein n=1 Tax=Pseudomonas sp. Au-Pse12 TaxID=2906459 RepID=UPI001E2CB02E|nr:thiol-disulfide oxidoreductase DCC family protein [Pseudomonas sp. Au-Pse12]MCE4057934.1 thiol-disulfide oxidoreductase DCC family protein [Pseudomonas sp. Au-Pse12]